MKYRVGDEVVLREDLIKTDVEDDYKYTNVHKHLGKPKKIKKVLETCYILDGVDSSFTDFTIDHEKTVELKRDDSLEKIVAEKNNVDRMLKERIIEVEQSDKYARHKEITDYMHNTYVSKNQDYGDSFEQTHEKYGPVAGLTRIADKFHRLENIILNDSTIEVGDETVIDTAIDMANYLTMLVMELEK